LEPGHNISTTTMAQGDDDRGPEMFDVTLSLLVVSTVTVAMRCYVRIVILKSFRIEDYMALATMVRLSSRHVHVKHYEN
jgi:hypothetical protein